AAGELVRLGDADQLQDAGQHFERARIDRGDVAGDADRGARGPGQRVRRQVHPPDGVEDLVDLLRRGVAVHDDEHGVLPGRTLLFTIPRKPSDGKTATGLWRRFAGDGILQSIHPGRSVGRRAVWVWVLLLIVGLAAAEPPFYPDKTRLLVYRDGDKEVPIATAADWAKRREHILANMQLV